MPAVIAYFETKKDFLISKEVYIKGINTLKTE